MPTIDNDCEFVAVPSKIHLSTNLNGDTLTIAGIELTQEQAAILAYLINGSDDLKIEISINT